MEVFFFYSLFFKVLKSLIETYRLWPSDILYLLLWYAEKTGDFIDGHWQVGKDGKSAADFQLRKLKVFEQMKSADGISVVYLYLYIYILCAWHEDDSLQNFEQSVWVGRWLDF